MPLFVGASESYDTDAWEAYNLKKENAKLRDGANAMRQLYEDELKHALAENAKLQETLQRRTEQFEGMTEMWVERGVENFKLRELVRDMWHEGMCECDECGACAECEYGYLDRMRELGVVE